MRYRTLQCHLFVVLCLEPDGSETDEGVKAEPSVKSLTVPPLHLDEKHCHCICHLPRPGMRLMWVPVEDKTHAGQIMNNGSLRGGDKSPDVEDSGRKRRTSIEVECSAVKSPTMPQCYSCRSFLLHHSPRNEAASESVYESMEVFSSAPPEEPIYLQLQPSDPASLTSLTRPTPLPRPVSTLRVRQKDMQPVLAYILSPRGGRPPIRGHSSRETGSGITQKPTTRKYIRDMTPERERETLHPS